MKRRALSLVLALALCLGLCVPAFALDAKEGDTTVTGPNGGEFQFSQPIAGTEEVKFAYDNWDEWEAAYEANPDMDLNNFLIKEVTENIMQSELGDGFTVLLVPMGTVITLPSEESAVVDDGGAAVSNIGGGEPFKKIDLTPDRVTDENRVSGYFYENEDGENVFAYDRFIPGAMFCVLSDGEGFCIQLVGDESTPAEPDAKPEETTPAEPDAKPEETKPEETTPAAPAEPAENPFTDVKADDYFYAPVLWAVEKGITNGTTDTTFTPGSTCTVAEILTFLWRAAGSPEAAIENPYTDLDMGSWYAPAAVWAYEKGMVTGDSFNASADCTRSMTVTYIWQAAESPEAAQPASFTDVAADADYAAAVAWAVEKAVTTGTSDTTFSPDDTCTRGQIVTFLYRAFA